MASATIPHLARLGRMHGLQTAFRDNDGVRRHASTEAMQAVLAAMGVEAESAADVRRSITACEEESAAALAPPVVVAWDGACATVALQLAGGAASDVACRLEMEDGTTREWRVRPDDLVAGEGGDTIRLPEVPHGYHDLVVECAGQTGRSRVIGAPRTAWPGPDREWGVFAPLYALRSERNMGAGDLADLRSFAGMAAELGAAMVGTLPLLAGFFEEPFEPSPYAPVSRLLWNELYADLGDARTERAAAQLRALPMVDYAEVYRAKRRPLQERAQAADAGEWAEVDAFEQQRPVVGEYARFRGAMKRTGQVWREWPERMRAGTLQPGDIDEDERRYHLYAQWLMARQVDDAAERAGEQDVMLYLDFPVGVHADGFDTWREQALFAEGASVGAPPDAFFSGGQDWGFPPMLPWEMRRQGYRHLVEVLQHHLRACGMLRIDHVMGLHRLYWVPRGLGATEGVYVRYPKEELYAVLCLESQRHGAAIVGEDLGTVPREVGQAMNRHGLCRMFVVETELQPQEPPLRPAPAGSVASLDTHDMSPFAAFWEGAGIEEDDTDAAARHERVRKAFLRQLRARDLLAERVDDPAEVASAAHCLLGQSRAGMVQVNIEDLWGETEPQNQPGTSTEQPNWRRKLRYSMEELPHVPAWDRLETLAQARRGEGGSA